MKSLNILISVSLFVVANGGVAMAADTPSADPTNPETSKGRALRDESAKLAAGPLGGGGPFSVGGLQVNASQDSSNATLGFTGTWASTHKDFEDPSTHRILATDRETDFSLNISTPIAKSASSTSLATTLDGLAASTNIKFKLGISRLPGIWWPSYGDVAAFRAKCLAESDKKPKASAAGGGAGAKDTPSCDVSDNQSLMPGVRSNKVAWAIGLSGGVGYESHTYYSSTTLAKSSENRTPWSAGAYAGLLDFGRDAALTFQYQYQEKYTDQTQKTMCPANSGSAPVTCATGSFGPPKFTIQNLVTLELKAITPPKIFGLPGGFGLDPTISYDLRSQKKSVDFPVYFFQNGGKGLTGGLRASWASDTHRASVGIFVSKPLTLFGN